MPVLRVILGAIGAAALAGAAILTYWGASLAIILWLSGIGLVLTLGTIFERVHYKRLAPRAPPGYVATEERFADPATGRMVQVHIKPETGERVYVDINATGREAGR